MRMVQWAEMRRKGLKTWKALPSGKEARREGEKAGYCPDFRQVSSDIRDCKQMCNDTSCPQNLRCCQRGCSWLCTNTTQEKDGMCPMAISSFSSEEQWRSRLCNRTCRTDLDCDGEAKCCASSCGRTCSMPVKVPPTAKPGRCPAVAKVCPEHKLQFHACQRDENCKESKKCCSSACGQRCMKPFPEEREAVTRSVRQEENTFLAL
ncbi:whey acidic protein-like [Petaurus breviceps papuanus]|uniref:whey acidic protein-like n=1 Tax=Petaurus breviceps papuanus TaxID=3040969 RepID=UPI0036DA251A